MPIIKLTKPYRDYKAGWEGEMDKTKCEELILRDNAVYIEVIKPYMSEIKGAKNKMINTTKKRKVVRRKRKVTKKK